MIVLLTMQDVAQGIEIPDNMKQLPWVLYAAGGIWIMNMITNNKIVQSLWEDILKPRLVNKGEIEHKAAHHEIDNRVTLSNAMDSIGYHYYFLARRLIDLVYLVNVNENKVRFVSEAYLRERMSSDIQRTKRLLGAKHLSNGLSLSLHLEQFSIAERNIMNFYAPIAKVLIGEVHDADLRDIVLKQVDRLYTQAEKFYQDNAEKKQAEWDSTAHLQHT